MASLIWVALNSREFGAQREIVDRLLELEALADARARTGALRVDGKYSNKPDYWNRLMQATNGRLIIMGRALQSWLKPEYEEHFKAAIERVARNGGDVCFLLLAPNGAAQKHIKAIGGRDHASKKHRTAQTLSNFRDSLPVRIRSNVELRYLPDDLEPYYMAIITDAGLDFTPYLHTEDSKDVVHLSFDHGSPFARSVVTDIASLRENSKKL
ncbi:hypothetical protein G7043_39720 [Lentzea sp. NEAU-D13]|uniref:Uncharacterized protein n=1 Tax=Lentzea alba TaxID=2714351 RepID=A0A7C9W807_9PSEU|nr:hypothetical protein [Lentzea alba]NGY65060.1 hypothetical protein [Lentzea alba]